MTNREIDVLIAKHVFGLIPPDFLCGKGRGVWEQGLPNYSTSIADAWSVVEKMPAIMLTKYTTGKYNCGVSGDKFYEAEADTASMAICLAALKAWGVEYEKASAQKE